MTQSARKEMFRKNRQFRDCEKVSVCIGRGKKNYFKMAV